MKQIQMTNRWIYVGVALLALLCFLPSIGIVHLFDWDEINFAESAREMIVSGNYLRVQINFIPFWEKPPLFFWLQVLSMKAFGINEFAARFPNVICGMLTLLFIFYVGSKHVSKRFAWIWILCIIGSFTPHFYFKSGIIDPFFNLFIFVAWYFMYSYFTKARKKYFFLSAISIGLAFITKGPVSVLVLTLSVLTVAVGLKKYAFYKLPQFGKSLLYYVLIVFVISLPWYGYEVFSNGIQFIWKFIVYQYELFSQPVATHGQPFYYHPVVLLFGCFPASIFALPYLVGNLFKKKELTLLWAMRILFWVVLILFSIVTTKIIHYSSLCYLPLTFIAAHNIHLLLQEKGAWSRRLGLVFCVVALPLALAFLLLPLFEYYKFYLYPFIDDDFAVSCMQTFGEWKGFEWLLGLFFIGLLIVFLILPKKKFYSFIFLFSSMALFINLFLRYIIPNVEVYSQRSAIELLQSVADRDAYVLPYRFYSYAPTFYGKVKPAEDPRVYDPDFLISHSVDKPVFFLMKTVDWDKQPLAGFSLWSVKDAYCLVKKD